MMTAEKAADLIPGNTPPPGEHEQFYRHEPPAEAGPQPDEQVPVPETG